MAGTFPVNGNYSVDDLANYLTTKEQLDFTQLTALTIDSTTGHQRNLATFVAQPNQLGPIAICAKGANSPGTKLFSTTAYISNAQTSIDVYRLALGS
jgi:hypothetical protein